MKERINKIIILLRSKELGILPGNLAYSFFLSIIPILTLLFYFLTSLHLPMEYIQNFLTETFPDTFVNSIQHVLNGKLDINSFLTLWLSIVVMTNGCNAIIVSSNTVYGFENANIFKRLIKSVIISFVLIVLIAFIIIVPLFGRAIINIIGYFTSFISNNKEIIDSLYAVLQIPISLIVIFLIIKLVYFIAPDERVSSKYMNKGSLFTTIGWWLITMAYSYYINNIARFDLVYGNLANIVILLSWFYILAYIFVIGLNMNKNIANIEIEKTNTIKLEEIRNKVKKNKK